MFISNIILKNIIITIIILQTIIFYNFIGKDILTNDQYIGEIWDINHNGTIIGHARNVNSNQEINLSGVWTGIGQAILSYPNLEIIIYVDVY